jgi:hypothetical protein
MLKNLERCCQLHERVEIHYYVDHYEAQLFTSDRKVAVGYHIDSIQYALMHLSAKLQDITLDQIRKLPEIR